MEIVIRGLDYEIKYLGYTLTINKPKSSGIHTMTTQTLPHLLEQVLGAFGNKREIPPLYPSTLRDPLLPAAYTKFYQVLLAVAGKRVVICPKMRLADILNVQPATTRTEREKYQSFYHEIATRSIDFVLCERYTLKPLLAIELYDHGQPRWMRKKRDAFIDRVFRAAHLPILHLVVQSEYNLRALAGRISPFLTTVAYSRDSEPIQLGIPPFCPRCHTPMVRRTVISGQYKGQTYYCCQDYPNCGERLPLSKARAYIN